MLKILTGTYRYVSLYDPAIDLEAWDENKRKSYFVDNFDLPPCKTGEKLTIWSLRPLSGIQMREVNACLGRTQEEVEKALSEEKNLDLIVRCGLVGVENLELDGFKMEFEDDHILGNVLTQKTLWAVFPFFRVLQVDIALMILSLSKMQF